MGHQSLMDPKLENDIIGLMKECHQASSAVQNVCPEHQALIQLHAKEDGTVQPYASASRIVYTYEKSLKVQKHCYICPRQRHMKTAVYCYKRRNSTCKQYSTAACVNCKIDL